MSVVLIGYRGSGKTTVGEQLARRLGMKFVDIDQRITGQTGKTIREIFRERGEAGFRELESQEIDWAVKLDDHVIAVGGGALSREENRRRLQYSGHGVIFLHCRPDELLRRIESDPGTADNRPHLTDLGGGREEIQKVLSEREPIYRLVMTAELDVTDLKVEEVVARIVEMLEAPPG
jgi:shikimate kinase